MESHECLIMKDRFGAEKPVHLKVDSAMVMAEMYRAMLIRREVVVVADYPTVHEVVVADFSRHTWSNFTAKQF